MKVLVTGTSGFIGSRLRELLREKKINFVTFDGDVTKTETYPEGNFEIIIHLAAKITHRGVISDDEVRATNVVGTRNLLDFYPCAKCVYISTTDVTRSELSLYAKTKLEAERLVSRGEANLIIRLPSVFGPLQVQDKLIPRLIRHYYLGEKCIITSDDLREYIYIDDVCDGIIENLENSGLVTLEGIKIRNTRLDELIRSIHADEKPNDLNADELKLWKQLAICCEAFDEERK